MDLTSVLPDCLEDLSGLCFVTNEKQELMVSYFLFPLASVVRLVGPRSVEMTDLTFILRLV